MNLETAHQEKHFEAHVVAMLAQQGWKVGTTDRYDTEAALYTEDLIDWLKATQPKVAAKLETFGGALPDTFKDALGQTLTAQGTVQVLRNGYKVAGFGHIDASASLPEDHRDPKAWKHYEANILRVVPQLKYRPGHNLAIDLVFFVNGLPVATVEVKTDFTQSAQLAVEQYKNDRKPVDPVSKRREPLLTFKRGAVVHFAMSESDIQMATKLDGENTFFLPFNKGKDGHAGNPARDDGEYPVAYFWEEVCQPDAWLRIFHNFVYIEKKDVVDLQGNWAKKETLIFPRFHQWDAVNKMILDAKAGGPGKAYLCEHSAGSGKTSTIAWTAHDLIKLRKPDGGEIFSSVVVVTDRTVLDAQLQDAVQQIDHQRDLIAAIDRDKSGKSKSQQLSAALKRRTPIIIVTIQTFPYAMEAILTDVTLKERNFAVIIDEAHNSQTGTAASKLQATLAMDSKESMEKLTVEELLEKIQKARLRPSNISHFAFTATPKHSTMMLFGRPKDPSKPAGKDNPPTSFHRYPMRQAIEEGFILDVLKGYTPYKTAFNLNESLAEGKRVDSKAAKRALAKWMVLHATNVSQKVQFIVEHFASNVGPLLEGRAKAMVVTSSRAAAVRYKKAFDDYIEKNSQHHGLKALVAFSGKLSGKDVMHASDTAVAGEVFIADDEATFTEATLNVGVPNSDLRIAFDRPEYRVMIVADKFQTGFDQPKLVAMYLDKKIANDVEIVQTLSRLNRVAPGKDTTFIIDFVNEPESILKAFAKYDSGARIEDIQDPNVVYKLQIKLDEAKIYRYEHLQTFRKARFQSLSDIASAKQPTHQALYAATQAPTDTFNGKVKALRDSLAECDNAYEKARAARNEELMKKADHLRKEHARSLKELLEFRNGLARFSQLYAYIAQLIDLDDPELENYAAFARLLSKRLEGIPPESIDLSGLLLKGYSIGAREQPGHAEEPEVLQPVGPGGGGQAPVQVYLKELIARLNALFGDATPLRDQVSLVNQVADIASESEVTMAQVQNTDRELALKGNLSGTVEGALVRALSSHQVLAKQLLKADKQALAPFTALIYELLKENRRLDLGDLGG